MGVRNIKMTIQIDPKTLKQMDEALKRMGEAMRGQVRAAVRDETRAIMATTLLWPSHGDEDLMKFRRECGVFFGDYAEDAYEYFIGMCQREAEKGMESFWSRLDVWRGRILTAHSKMRDFPISMKGWERRKRETRELIMRLEEWLRT